MPHFARLEEEEDEGEDDYLSDNQSTSSEGNDEFPPQPPSQNYFAPPFYGRPPTPLPPSPSLTSLLRPSRPTTPDASDDDTAAGGDTAGGGGGGAGGGMTHEGVNAGSSSTSSSWARAAPKVPTYEYYGFVLYLFSSFAFLIYLLWAYLPSPFLHALGIYYYPNRWWALAVPAFIVAALCYTYVALGAYNVEVLTEGMASLGTVVDGAGAVAAVGTEGYVRRRKGGGRDGGGGGGGVVVPWREVWGKGTDAVLDIPLGGVCEVLYGDEREDS
ncbi:hypothetical protein N3K66_005689 [Trichothecium roseum]|uniref:Uncharacterized protein n=1 Tax=Trichothecium roseum TaxID=47278 RepID=A0ACC0UYK3_9HYPO|nr:hypothetical protein N3K66_005689 [Trichothecium roseum]